MIAPEILRAKFAVSFTRRLTDLHDILDRGDLIAAERGFHSLAGIGGTYGFPLVTTLARRAEQHCGSARQAKVQRLLDRLMAIATELREERDRAAA
ncbi:MAG: Hpt domain [Acidobacteriota bacterium]|jgi:HPt (histidine-containing phosphotransfer) domain-containing protein|nr:Hpt domain [Acidobacteriota bacterium]